MLEFKTGDLFLEEAQAVVNTVNCVGVMGRGIALQFKKKFPENFKAYDAACKMKNVQPGKMFIFETCSLMAPQIIVNFPTKRHWRGKSRIEDIDAGLLDLVRVIKERKITSIALPPLGCGLGGLDWSTVRSKIVHALEQVPDVRVVVFEPKGAPHADEMVKNREVPRMTKGRAALVELMQRYLGGLLDPFVTLLEVHKLMYFMQEAGEPLKLQYSRAPYGPYAENLRHVLNRIEGHLVSGYVDGGDEPDKRLTLVPGAVNDAQAFLASYPETQERFTRVADLVEGFETPFGLELLSTVHWVLKHDGVTSMQDTITKVYSWSERKKQFSSRQIEIAVKALADKNWAGLSGWKDS